MPKAWYNKLVDMLTSWFGVLLHNSKWNQHVRFFQPRRALPPDEPQQQRPIGLSSVPLPEGVKLMRQYTRPQSGS
jgi:hypothetical protein